MKLLSPLRHLTQRSPKDLLTRSRILSTPPCTIQSRNASTNDGERNPVLDEYLRKNPGASEQTQKDMLAQQRAMVQPGDLASSSIFEDEQRVREQEQDRAETGETAQEKRLKTYDTDGRTVVLDPDPNARERWERKKVIQAIRKGGRMTRPQMIRRQEREHTAKSENMKTSVKKLGMLARQIAGKSLDDALVQMEFSKKKAAETVHAHLLQAKNEAIVARGMGLGGVAASEEEETQSTLIRRKDGTKHVVKDPTKIYIDQAWVGKGPYGKLPEYRARGRMNILRTPFTSLSVLLKEESTLVREHKDREDKRRRQRLNKVWKHLPDRPLQGPRGQYYSW